MNKGLFKFDYIVYDGTNFDEFKEEFEDCAIEQDGKIILDLEDELEIEKGKCLIFFNSRDYLYMLSPKEFKENHIGDIKG